MSDEMAAHLKRIQWVGHVQLLQKNILSPASSLQYGHSFGPKGAEILQLRNSLTGSPWWASTKRHTDHGPTPLASTVGLILSSADQKTMG